MESAPKTELELCHFCSKTLQYDCQNSDCVEFTVKEEEPACDSCGTDSTESAPETQIELSHFKSNTEQTVQTETVCDDTPCTEKVIKLGVIISKNVQIENANSLTVKCEANLEQPVMDNICDGETDIEGEVCDGNATIVCDGQGSASPEITSETTVKQNTNVSELSAAMADPIVEQNTNVSELSCGNGRSHC